MLMVGRGGEVTMFQVRLEEHPIPTSKKDVTQLIDWLVATFGLIRRRGEEHAFGDAQQPVVRLLREHFLANPIAGVDANALGDELGLAPASLHHHLSRLSACRLISSRSEGDGWRRHFLRGGCLSAAVELFSQEARMLLQMRLADLDNWWDREGGQGSLKIAMAGASESPALRLWVTEPSPQPDIKGASELSNWMAEMGLLGERPGKAIMADSVAVKLFSTMLARTAPLSIDEAVEMTKATKPRLIRILERFHAAGIVERVARIDRLPTILWEAMESQFRKRGEDWLLLKGGFNRQLPPRQAEILVKALKKGKLNPELVEKNLAKVSPEEQMLLLNLLGGRLPFGYRMVGDNPKRCAEMCMSKLDRVLRRIRRVAEQLEKAYSEG